MRWLICAMLVLFGAPAKAELMNGQYQVVGITPDSYLYFFVNVGFLTTPPPYSIMSYYTADVSGGISNPNGSNLFLHYHISNCIFFGCLDRDRGQNSTGRLIGVSNGDILDISSSVFSNWPAEGSMYSMFAGPGQLVPYVAAVPEPSTWAMLLIGFAGIGFAAYRKRRRYGKTAIDVSMAF